MSERRCENMCQWVHDAALEFSASASVQQTGDQQC